MFIGFSRYSIMMKDLNQAHRFNVRKKIVQYAQDKGIRSAVKNEA